MQYWNYIGGKTASWVNYTTRGKCESHKRWNLNCLSKILRARLHERLSVAQRVPWSHELRLLTCTRENMACRDTRKLKWREAYRVSLTTFSLQEITANKTFINMGLQCRQWMRPARLCVWQHASQPDIHGYEKLLSHLLIARVVTSKNEEGLLSLGLYGTRHHDNHLSNWQGTERRREAAVPWRNNRKVGPQGRSVRSNTMLCRSGNTSALGCPVQNTAKYLKSRLIM